MEAAQSSSGRRAWIKFSLHKLEGSAKEEDLNYLASEANVV